MANVFHVFCALFLLSQEELHSLDTKIDEIHTLFDFDKSGGLNRVELECLFQACVEGLARATGTKAPLNSATISSNADDMCDAYGITMDGSCEVSVSMLREWVAGREDIIAYLSEFTEAHTVVGYQRKVEEAFERVTASFVAEALLLPEQPRRAPGAHDERGQRGRGPDRRGPQRHDRVGRVLRAQRDDRGEAGEDPRVRQGPAGPGHARAARGPEATRLGHGPQPQLHACFGVRPKVAACRAAGTGGRRPRDAPGTSAQSC